MSFILGANYQYYLGFSALCTRISALLPGTFCSISYFFDNGFTLVEPKQNLMGNGRLGLCLAPGVWDMGHLAGLPARGAGGLCDSVWSSRSLPVSSVVPRSPEVCGLGPLCLTDLLDLWGFLLLLLALFSEITKSRILR